jgi:hypothetical protein
LNPSGLAERAASELLAAVVGSGVMAFNLAGGNGALALLCHTPTARSSPACSPLWLAEPLAVRKAVTVLHTPYE